jgi:hypothetical protein
MDPSKQAWKRMPGKREQKSKFSLLRFLKRKDETIMKKNKTAAQASFTVFLLLIFCINLPGEDIQSVLQKNRFFFRMLSSQQKIGPILQKKLKSLYDIEETLKIWIYFKDKGLMTQRAQTVRLNEAKERLNERSLWRRSKVRPNSNLVDHEDIALYSPFLEKVRSIISRERITSRWLNAMSAEADLTQIIRLEKLDFVQKIELVLSFKGKEISPEKNADLLEEPRHGFDLTYGPSFAQIEQINVLPLHQMGYSGKDVLVCLLDTGFRKSHEIFNHATVIAEWDFVNGDGDVQQDLNDQNDYSDSHGTATWSILGGFKPGELIGPAYGADFILAKTESVPIEQPIEEDYWVAGIEWAEGLGAEVVSSSLGYTDWYTFADLDGKTAVTTLAADRAVDLGVVVVNSVGNERNDPWQHINTPSDGFGVIAVGAVNSYGTITSFSSPGPTYDGRIKPEVCARGFNTWMASNEQNGGDIYRTGDGTSLSAPLVAGVAALLLEIHRDWTPSDVRAALLSTADRSTSPDNDYGWGIVNAAAAASLNLPLPRISSFSIDDDNTGESSGNGDGIANAGETLEITVNLTNQSQTPSPAVNAVLSSTHPDVMIFRPQVVFPALPSFGTSTSSTPFVVKIPPSFFGHHLVFRLISESSTNIYLNDSFRISVSR